MKRITIISLMLTMMVFSMWAIPANRRAVTVTQPDGTTVTIQLHGDEWLHFNTTADGYTVEKNQQGYYVYALQDNNGELKATNMVAHDVALRKSAELAFLQNVSKYQAPKMSEETVQMRQMVQQRQKESLAKHRAAGKRTAQYDYNNFRGLVILVQFNDKEFSREDYATIANDMVNKENYTGFDNEVYTGSVRDYFSDNSGGKFKPQFDVVGPYTVDYSQYAPDGTANSKEILLAAVDAANADVDYSQYDGDGDGFVDLVYFIVAGNASSFGGNDSRLFWPHRSVLLEKKNGRYYYVNRDGVILSDYASSVELYGWTSHPSTVKIDGIGTICHEFSHVLGLPDFYDANYEENGQSNDPGNWSVMASGSYFNDSRTPLGYSLYERYSVGFMDEPSVISQKGSYTLEPLASSQTGYRLNTPVANEFFLLENRQKDKFKWDAYLPGNGMLVHRVDFTRERVWSANQVNNDSSHNYYELLRANGYVGQDSDSDPFPGARNVQSLTNSTSPANLKSWAGKNNRHELFNITTSGDNINFTVDEYQILLANTINEFNNYEKGKDIYLELDDAQVLYVYTKSGQQYTYLRDNSGALMVAGVRLPVKVGDVINGTIFLRTEEQNEVPMAVGVDSSTDYSGLSIVSGDEPQPREVVLEQLTAADYNDLIKVKSVKIKKSGGIFGNFWAYGDNTENTARLWGGNFGVGTGLSATTQLTDKCFDITAIYGTNTLNGSIINELNVTKSVEESEVGTGIIQNVNGQTSSADSPQFNLAGQRVDENFKGLVIKDGRKVVIK